MRSNEERSTLADKSGESSLWSFPACGVYRIGGETDRIMNDSPQSCRNSIGLINDRH